MSVQNLMVFCVLNEKKERRETKWHDDTLANK